MGALKQLAIGMQAEYDDLLDLARSTSPIDSPSLERLQAISQKFRKLVCPTCPVCGAYNMNSGVCYRCHGKDIQP